MSSRLTYRSVFLAILCVAGLSRADTVVVEPSQDTWINTARETTNYGGADHMEVYTDSTFPPPNRSGLVQFSLPTLPSGAILQSATLSLYYYDNIYMDSDDVLGVGVYAVEVLQGYLYDPGQEYQRRDWTEYGATWRQFKSGAYWQTYGCEDTFYDRWSTPDATLEFRLTTGLGWKTWTVTSRVAQWYSGADVNRGWLVRVSSISAGDNSGAMFYTKEGTYHPRLTITYTVNGACCFDDGHCEALTQSACTQAGGTQWIQGVPCIPNPCPQPEGACCFPDGHCEDLTEAECSGDWLGYGTACTPINPCPQPPTGACCFGTVCEVRTEAQCLGQEGEYKGDGTDCFPNPCVTLNYYLRVAGGMPVEQGGDGYQQRWYRYHEEWWAQWWPNEFDLEREKVVTITFDIEFLGFPPIVAFNYAAPEWPDEQNPPLPADEPFVVRVPVEPPVMAPGTYSFATRLPLCPRWVSMDVQGRDFAVQGTIAHVCLPTVTGACCHGICSVLTPAACAAIGGVYLGDDVPCLPNPCICPGDLNCDAVVSFKDINPFVQYMSNYSAWEMTYVGCNPLNGDINRDGAYPSFADINPFVALLSSGPVTCGY